MLTRQDFVEKHRHELAGIAFDAALAGRKGGELALWARTMLVQIDRRLGMIYDELTKPAGPHGASKPPMLQRT